MVIPKEYYQKTSGLQSLSRSLIQIGNPLIAAAIYSLSGLDAVIGVDLITFSIAFIALAIFIKIPDIPDSDKNEGNVLSLAKDTLPLTRIVEPTVSWFVVMFGIKFTFLSDCGVSCLTTKCYCGPHVKALTVVS